MNALNFAIHTVDVSKNSKVGTMPVTTSDLDTCPDVCPMKPKSFEDSKKSPCYHFSGFFTGQTAKRLHNHPEKYKDLDQFVGWILSLPIGQIWRDRIGGDQVPSVNRQGKPTKNIEAKHFRAKIRANKRRKARGFGFTHYGMNAHNVRLLLEGYAAGFVLNASANTLTEAIKLKRKHPELSVVATAPADYSTKSQKVDGIHFVQCPATWNDKVTCLKCQICTIPNRDYVVVFPSHGTQKAKLDIIASDKNT